MCSHFKRQRSSGSAVPEQPTDTVLRQGHSQSRRRPPLQSLPLGYRLGLSTLDSSRLSSGNRWQQLGGTRDRSSCFRAWTIEHGSNIPTF